MAALFFPTGLRGIPDGVSITWNDGRVDSLTWRQLREACPCANCKVQREQPPAPAQLLPVLSAAEARPLKATGVHPLGNYAYQFDFTDGHTTGIYTLEFLRQLGSPDQPA